MSVLSAVLIGMCVVCVLTLTVLFYYFSYQYTEEEARKLGVVGWVKNTSQGTVTGQVQGPEDKVNAIKSVVCSVDKRISAGKENLTLQALLWIGKY
uniref:Acylphosphatase-2 n=1 Tax=Gallus gallus TaxID=9031 RepID=A0A8V0YRY2_CHICK